MTAEQLTNFLIAAGIPSWAIYARDAHYVFPAQRWIETVFAKAFAKVRTQFSLGEWAAEIGDCDDFADLAAVYARYLHRLEYALGRAAARALNQEPESPAAIAFGSFEYLIGADPSRGHAINVAIVNEGGQPELMFFEPQTGQKVDLTPEEICSCEEIRF